MSDGKPILRNNIEPVQQPTLSSCVHTCLSMVTGIDVKEVMALLPQPCGPTEFIPWLTRKGVHVERTYRMFYDELYLVDTASLSSTGTLHFIVMDARNCDRVEDVRLYDPLEGKKVFTGLVYEDMPHHKRNGLDALDCYSTLFRLVDCNVSVELGKL